MEFFLNREETGGAYIYQGNSIVVPADTPDSLIQEEVSRELIDGAFSSSDNIDSFTAPPLDGGLRGISFVSIPEGDLPPLWKAIPLRQAVNIITGGTIADGIGSIGRMFRSYHISQWRRESRFCGSCGAANSDAGTGELARQCPACGRIEFPRIAPAVITVITNDAEEALLAHNKKFAAGVYSLIAGFNEAGESLEATVAREIKEEVNLDVEDIRYIRSQPWPFPNSLMCGFSARYRGGQLKPDGTEIDDARWFTRDNLPALPGNGSISRYLINLWCESRL